MNFGPSGPYPDDTYVYLALQKYGIPQRTFRDYLIPEADSYSPSPWDSGSLLEMDDKSHAKNHGHLDAITESLFEEKKFDPLSDFFSARKEFLARCIEDLTGLIYEREQIRYESFQKIDYDSCKAGTRVREVERWPPGTNATADKVRSNAERELFAFEREKRMEEVACWRDITRVKTELREIMREWSQEKQKESFLEGGK